MSRKGENIFQRKDGRWEARYVKGHELSGKIKYGFCYGRTYKEAKTKVEQIKAAILNDKPVLKTGSRHRFAFFCEEWLKIQKTRVKESTYVKYDSMLRCHILPKLGGCYPLGISAQTVEAFKTELLEEGLSVQSVRNVLIILHSILHCMTEQYPGIFPTVNIRYPKEVKEEPRVLSIEEQRRLISYLEKDMDECKFGVLLAMLTGLRIGEICALRWENLSLRDNTIQIRATMQRIRDLNKEGKGKTKILIGNPKSDTSIRTIPLPDSMAELCRQKDPHCLTAYILTGTESYMEPRKLQRRLQQYTKECELEGIHFHTLRHTFATRCMEAGFELKSLSEILGHAKASTTLDRYVHSSMEVKRTNMAKLPSAGL